MQWCISDLDQWVTDLDDTQFWAPYDAPAPERKRDARAYEYDDGNRLREIIEDDNEFIELFAILLAAVTED